MKEFSGNFKSVAIVLLFGLVCGLSAENPAQNQGTKAQIKDVSVEEAANEGKRPVTFTVVLPNQPSATEEFAAGELASYLKKMTGREPNRIAENSVANVKNAIYLGQTKTAERAGFSFSRFDEERWTVCSSDAGLIIGGGGLRGTLYGVYHYLEDICGVRWFNPAEEDVPKLKNPPLDSITLAGKPVFTYRLLYVEGHDLDSMFLSRLRQNADLGPWKVSIWEAIRPMSPAGVHSMLVYLPPEKYSKDHPEYYALGSQGARKYGQLCLMNPGTRQAMLKVVRELLAKRYAMKASLSLPSMQFFDMSHMDNGDYCHCEACTKFAQGHGDAFSAVNLDFVNYIADEIAKDYPDIIFTTFAYTFTEKPPKGIRPKENVLVLLCDTQSSEAAPIESSQNHVFQDYVRSWGEIADNLRIHDYWTTYDFQSMPSSGITTELPLPSEFAIAPDLRFFQANNCRQISAEFEYPAEGDVHDFKQYLYLHLMENPELNVEWLMEDFANRFYGAAGKLFLQYRRNLLAAYRTRIPFIGWDPTPGMYAYLDTAFLAQSEKLFDEGSKLLKNDMVRLRRWNHARIALDRAVLMRVSYLAEEFCRNPRQNTAFPFDLKLVRGRVAETWRAAAELRYNADWIRVKRPNSTSVANGQRKNEVGKLNAELERWRLDEVRCPVPEQMPTKLKNIPVGKLHVFPLASCWSFQNKAKPTDAPDSLFGQVLRLEFEQGKTGRFREEALQAFSYDRINKRILSEIKLPMSEVKQAGWNWIHFGKIKAAPDTYLALTYSWHLQFDISGLADPNRSTREYDLWIRARFAGKDFPCGEAKDKNSMEFDSIILADPARNDAVDHPTL